MTGSLKAFCGTSSCWATANPPHPAGIYEQTTLKRWHQVHDLLETGVSLLDMPAASTSPSTRSSATREPGSPRTCAALRPLVHLADPYRDHLRIRCAADAAISVQQLCREIKDLGYTGSLSLLYRYITQGVAEGDRPSPSCSA